MDQKAVYGLQGLSFGPFAEDTLGDHWEKAFLLEVRDDYIHSFKHTLSVHVYALSLVLVPNTII